MARVQDSEFAMNLGGAIKKRREWLELSQAELGRRLGVSGAQVSKFEVGQDSVSALMLVRLATALGTSVNVLLGTQKTLVNALIHYEEMMALIADGHVDAVIKAMQPMVAIDRARVADLVQTFAKGLAP